MLLYRRIFGILLPVVLAMAIGGCGDDESPTSIPDPLVSPPVPSDITGTLGESEVSLEWEISSMDGISAFAVYRSDDLNTEFVLIDNADSPRYVDDRLVPGRTYTYQVSSIGTNGLESGPSGAFVITPGTYGMVINDRAEFTSDRAVVLTFTAPSDAASMMIANDSIMAGRFFEVFSLSRSWTLADGDGSKSVYARFRTEGGTVSAVHKATITLDTKAEILSLSESSGGEFLHPGDTLSLEMRTDEGGGSATVSIGGGLLVLSLPYDENSGSYRVEAIITPGFIVTDAVITGAFTDRAGNAAAPFWTGATLTVVDTEGSPAAVQLNAAADSDTNWIALSWTRNEESDFAEYRVYRGTVPSVESGDGDDQVIAVITDRDVTTHVDSLSLRDTTQYFYRVFVKDTEENLTGSNEVPVFTRNSAPGGVESFGAAAVDSPSTDVRLTWSAVDLTAVHDFAEYRIYRSTSEAVSEQSLLIGQISREIESSHFIDEVTDQATTYYYRIYVVDEGDLQSGSDAVSVVTTDLDPSYSVLSAPTVDLVNQNVSLTWQANGDPDFASYVIYFFGNENQTIPNPGSFSAIDTLNNPAAANYAHYPNVRETPYFAEYFVDVVDRAGHRTRSNIVQAVFGEAGLPQISDIVVTALDSTAIVTFLTDVPASATISYSAESLALDRTASGGPALQIAHTITLTPLEPASEHFYQIEVTNERGVKNYSGIGSFTTAETPVIGGTP